MFVSKHLTKHPQLTVDSALDISTKDTILSAGSIDTPKILLLSGIGDSEQLKTQNIPIVLDQPSIGVNLRDHVVVRMAAAIEPGSFELPGPNTLQEAREQWLRDRSGPLSGDTALLEIGYLKLPITSYPEYATLDRRTQALLSHPDVPAYEQIFVCFTFFLALYKLYF